VSDFMDFIRKEISNRKGIGDWASYKLLAEYDESQRQVITLKKELICANEMRGAIKNFERESVTVGNGGYQCGPSTYGRLIRAISLVALPKSASKGYEND